MDSNVKEILKELKNNYFKNESDDKTKYTYYNLDLSHKDFMIIIQNPGAGKKKNRERFELANCKDDEEFIRCCRKWLQIWIEEQGNKDFWSQLIKDVQLINKNIRKDNILDYFAISDIIKRRGKTGDVEDFEKDILKKEIELIKPILILAISSRTWNSIKNIFDGDIIKVDNKENININSVSKEHGFLFKLKHQET